MFGVLYYSVKDGRNERKEYHITTYFNIVVNLNKTTMNTKLTTISIFVVLAATMMLAGTLSSHDAIAKYGKKISQHNNNVQVSNANANGGSASSSSGNNGILTSTSAHGGNGGIVTGGNNNNVNSNSNSGSNIN